MADFVNFGRSLVEHVSKSFSAAKGAKIKYSMSGKELENFISNPDNPELLSVWRKLGLDKKKGITLDIATKAKSNYNIASINLRTDTSSLVSGCYSTSKEATGEVAKYHFSDKKKVYQGYETSETELDRVTPNTTIPLTPQKLAQLKEKRLNLKDLSKIFKRSINKISLMMPKQLKHRRNIISYPKLKESLLHNLTPEDIAAKEGTTVQTVYNKMKQAGFLTETAVKGEYRATASKPYEGFENEKLIFRLLDYDFKNKELNTALEAIADTADKSNITPQIRSCIIALLKKLDFGERKILTGDELLKSKELKVLQNWAKKAEETEKVNKDWDNVLNNILPASGHKEFVEMFRKYRLKNADAPNIELVKKYTKLLSEPDSDKFNKNLTKIIRLETFKNVKDPKLKYAAESFAIDSGCTTDSEIAQKAGQYLMILKAFRHPETAKAGYLKDFANFLKSEKYMPEELAIRNLVKVDNYFSQHPDNFLMDDFCKAIGNNNEGIKNSVDKHFIEIFLSNFYLKNNTNILTQCGNGKTQISKLMKSAKEQIVDYFGFPKNVTYLRKFERAMTRFTSDKDSRPGIKLVKYNRKYAAEVKIGGEDDRLMSKDGIIFDEFELGGLHKKKKGKRA